MDFSFHQSISFSSFLLILPLLSCTGYSSLLTKPTRGKDENLASVAQSLEEIDRKNSEILNNK